MKTNLRLLSFQTSGWDARKQLDVKNIINRVADLSKYIVKNNQWFELGKFSGFGELPFIVYIYRYIFF